jgi:signal transduction histidine kinase
VIQEAVNNVIKHSKASQLDISIINEPEGLRVTIEDNGIGFNKSDLTTKNGIGMKNIKARIEFLKGTLDIDSKPGKGTLIAFFIPNQK